MALIHADRIDEPRVRVEIDELTRSFPEPIDHSTVFSMRQVMAAARVEI